MAVKLPAIERAKIRLGDFGDYSPEMLRKVTAEIEAEDAAAAVAEGLQPVQQDPPPKKHGRPKKLAGEGKVYSLWLDKDTIDDLRYYAKRYGLTVSDLVRLFIGGGLGGCRLKEAAAQEEKEVVPDPAPLKIPQPNISTVGRH